MGDNKNIIFVIFGIFILGISPQAFAFTSDGNVTTEQKISDTEGNFGGILTSSDSFGASVANIGDLDGDGIEDLAVGSFLANSVSSKQAIWILFMNVNGTVKSEQKISNTEGGFGGVLEGGDFFGSSIAGIGDLDGDGIEDLAVGAEGDDFSQFNNNRGAVWILFMNTNGTVASEQKISDTEGGFGGILDNNDSFGNSIANIGDLDGNNVTDIAVGAIGDDDGGTNRGAVWILFMNANGTVSSEQKISDTEGGFGGVIDNFNFFGQSIASIGDLDGNNVTDIAVGAERDDDGGADRGAAWILFMNANGTVSSEQKISDTEGGFGGVLKDEDYFGSSIANVGDLNDDNITDLAVGAERDDDGGADRGAAWILFMNANGTVSSEQKISDIEGTFDGILSNSNRFGSSIAGIGDLDGDGIEDLAVGALLDDAVWILFMKDVDDPADDDGDGDGFTETDGDCDDTDPTIHPDAFDIIGNGIDEDCSGTDAGFDESVSIPFGTSVPGCEATNSCYIPFQTNIFVGGTVTWTNDDSASHTVTSGNQSDGQSGEFDSSLLIAGQTFLHTFETVGTFDYFCILHPWMEGEVLVVELVEDSDGDGFNSSVDCNDNDATIHPGAPELDDGKDNDCDGEIDEVQDTEGDGVSDGVDNCPTDFNPLQKDLDMDFTGDACDILNESLVSTTVSTDHSLIGDWVVNPGVLVTVTNDSNINQPPGSKLVVKFPGGVLITDGSSWSIS